MPNLAGICHPGAAQQELERDLGRMLDAIDLPAFGFERRRAFAEGVACGNVLPGIDDNASQPAIDRAGGLWLMLDGEILDTDGLKRAIGTAPELGTLDDAALALRAYQTFGLDFVDRLNGQWNIVLHDASAAVTYVITDRIGSRLLYAAEDGARLVFSSEAKGVIAGRHAETRAGGRGLLELFAGGQHYGRSTWLEGISAIEPGTILRVSREGRSRWRYFRFHFREGGPEMSEDDYAEGFARRLRRATERCMKSAGRFPIGMTLSGGLDSRAVALSIDRRRLPIPALTYGDPDSADVLYATQLANVIGLEHLYVEQFREGLVRDASRVLDRVFGAVKGGRRGLYGVQLDRVLWRSEGMSVFPGMCSMIWHPLYQQRWRIFLNGACGDALTGSHLSPKLLAVRGRQDIVRDHLRACWGQPRELVESVLRKDFVARFWDELPGAFAALFEEIDADEPMAMANIWDMENRQRRGAFSTFTIERYFASGRSPFLDYELAEFLSTVPPMWRFQQRIYKRMIVRQYPDAAHVPWAYTRGRITDSPGYELLREAANFTWRRVQGSLPWKKQGMRHFDFRNDVELLRREPEVASIVRRWVSSRGFPGEVFDARGISAVVDRFESGEGHRETATVVSHLVAMARWHEWFLCGEARPIPPAADPASFGVTPAAPGVVRGVS